MMRLLAALFLSVVLAMTSVTLAVARAQPAGVAEMVICSDGAAVTVLIDAQGNPVEVPHHCPDCLTALATAHATLPAARITPVLWARVAPPSGAKAVAIHPVRAAPPRGPPVLS